MPYIALPPGVYYIQSTEKEAKNVTSPSAHGSQLFVADPTTEAKQQWLITSDGAMVAMESHSFSWTDLTENLDEQHVNRHNSKSIQWIIKVKRKRGKFEGTILTPDKSQRSWGLNGNNVRIPPLNRSRR
ncbi:hypothetical protein CVT26_010674 [Gymnopilus dilepis]|uniref:Ricin B lectin domain-containing protein n=1 Tax=Gymnopilus dilepis TaxID=231916 RepID=A0A409Y0S5_9AGAR|nr:hypothetical protein CVT26_010674 [Gymnopilus dilepis]